MNQAALQKQQEREFLERFRESHKGFPNGEIIDSESPDFMIEDGGTCVVGIEVTEFYGQLYNDGLPSLQAQENRKGRVLRRVKEACEANGLSNFQVSVDFHPGRKLVSAREHDFTQELAQLIQRNLPSPGDKICLSQTPKISDRPPDEIIRVWIARPSNSDEPSHVVSSAGGISPQYTLYELQKEVDRKEKKVSIYAKRCPEVWLLIVGGQNLSPSTWIDLPRGISEHRFGSSFNKVFFLHCYRKEVTEFLLND